MPYLFQMHTGFKRFRELFRGILNVVVGYLTVIELQSSEYEEPSVRSVITLSGATMFIAIATTRFPVRDSTSVNS